MDEWFPLLSAFQILCGHIRWMQLLTVLWVLHRVWKTLLLKHARRLYYALAAETPRLQYQPTKTNNRILASCKTMNKYCPPWHLFNGHVQTLRLGLELTSAQPAVAYERQILDMPDGGILSLDWALPANAGGSIPRVSSIDRTKPTMLVVPGLTGGSSDFYIRCVVHRMVTTHGWQVAVMNARGCSGTPLKTPRLFCCGSTDDLRFVFAHFHKNYDFVTKSTLIAVGFCMGSNVLVKYLGEETHDAKKLVFFLF